MNSLEKAQTRIRLQYIENMRRFGVIHGIVETDPDSSRERKTHFHKVLNRRQEKIKVEAYKRLQTLS